MKIGNSLSGIAATLMIVFTSACGDGLASLPLPAPELGSTATYRLRAVFANALNLPTKAQVKLAGADIGELESTVAKNYTAHTTLRIRSGVQLPVGSTAELRSATPLGDVFISIKPPEDILGDAPILSDGDTIDIGHTTSAATVEAVLSSASVLVNGGAVRNLAKVANGLGKAAGGNGEAFGEILRKSNQLLNTMNSRAGQFDTALAESKRLTETLRSSQGQITDIMNAGGPAVQTLASNTGQIADMVDQVSGITQQLAKFPSVQGTDTRSMIADLNTVSATFNEVSQSPDPLAWSVNRLLPPFVKVASGTAIPGVITVEKIALGSIPDIGYPGDPGFHGPKRADWQYFIGSIRYTLLRLQERVVGQGPGNP